MQRIVHLYSRMALLVFNTLIALSVMLLLAARLIPPRNAVPPGVYSSAFRLDSYKIIDRAEAIATGKDFDAMGEEESYDYNPWTTFQESVFSGALVHVDQGMTSSIRRTKAPASGNDRPTLTVWAFGGSTMFGWGLPDEQTIPSHLQGELQGALPDRQFRVINYGHAYYTSSEETALFSALLRTENKPDVALFLDGLNDVRWFGLGLREPYFAGIARDGWNKERSRNYVELFTIGSRYVPPMATLDNPAQEIVSRYRNNRAQRAALARAFGIDAYFFLQPVTFLGQKDAPPGADEAYRVLSGDNLYSLVDALAGLPDAYVDSAHYSDMASLYLARRMAAIINRRYTIF